MSPSKLQFGLNTFGDITQRADGSTVPGDEVIREIFAEGVLADQLGIDAFGIGEHHRDDYAVSAPDTLLAGLATVTKSITLSTAVTVLSSDDPIRVYERFATIDALSEGRAEVTLGRGSFTESFPLFGYSLADYEKLFEEKLDLFAAARGGGPFSWSGTIRPALKDQELYPPVPRPIPAWIAAGGSPNSVVRAARYGMPLMLAIIGGPADRFVPYARLYREALEKLEQPAQMVGVHSPGHIAATDEQAREDLREAWIAGRNRIGAERGWGAAGPDEFDAEIEHGALYVGSPETVAQKIARTARIMELDRFDVKYANGPLSHEKKMESIRLYAEEVIPRVRELLG